VPVPGDDGWLTLADLLGRWRNRLRDTELTVLSACNTARGSVEGDEGVLALPLGFSFAGCPAVVASLWRVDDDSTAILMEEFYRALLARGGDGKAETLRDARRALREKQPDPWYWAPFVLLGDPR
jgi:CHAT domain-containing protein